MGRCPTPLYVGGGYRSYIIDHFNPGIHRHLFNYLGVVGYWFGGSSKEGYPPWILAKKGPWVQYLLFTAMLGDNFMEPFVARPSGAEGRKGAVGRPIAAWREMPPPPGHVQNKFQLINEDRPAAVGVAVGVLWRLKQVSNTKVDLLPLEA